MKLTEFYSCALGSPKNGVCLLSDAGGVASVNAQNPPTQNDNIQVREALAKTLETEIKAGTFGLEKALDDLRINNRNDPLTGGIVDGYRLQFRNTKGFQAVSGMPVENDAYFSHEAKYTRSFRKAVRSGSATNKIIRWKHWLKKNKVRILQKEVMRMESARSDVSSGNAAESKKLRASIKSYDKIWKALCRGKRSRFTRKKEWTPLYQGGVLVKDGELRNLSVLVLARKLSDECKLLSATTVRPDARVQKPQEELRRQIRNDYVALQSLIDDCKIDAKNNELASAISLGTLDAAATAIDLHAIATEEAGMGTEGTGEKNFFQLLKNVYLATCPDENVQRTVRGLKNFYPEQPRRRNWVQQRRDNVSLRRNLWQACEDSGFFDKGFLTQFWTKHHEEFLGKDTDNVNALQIKAFIDELGKKAASKEMLLNVGKLHSGMITDPNANPGETTGHYQEIDLGGEIEVEAAGHPVIYEQLAAISNDVATRIHPWLKPKEGTDEFEMNVLGHTIPINKENINAIETRISKQYIANHGLVPLGNGDKEFVHGDVLTKSPPLLACLDYLEETHELTCEQILRTEMHGTDTLETIFGTGNPATRKGLQQLLSDTDKTDLKVRNRLHAHLEQGLRAAYKESEDPLSEFVSKEALVKKLQTSLPNLRNVPYADDDETGNQVSAYQTLLCADIPEEVFENAKTNLPRMREALRVLENPEKRLEDRLSALAKLETVFKEVENTNVASTIFLKRPGTATGDRPDATRRLPILGYQRDDFDTRDVKVDHDILAKEAEVRSKPEEPEDPVFERSDESAAPAPDDQPKVEFAKLQGDALRLRLMTVFSDLSRIMDDTPLFVGERKKEAVPTLLTSQADASDPSVHRAPVESREDGPEETPPGTAQQLLGRPNTDPAIQFESAIEIAPKPQQEEQPEQPGRPAPLVDDAETSQISQATVDPNDFQREVGAIRAVVRARGRGIRLQRELAHRRKASFEPNQPYEIRGAGGQPVDTGWLENLAGLVRVGQIVSTVNNAPSQLVSAFTYPLGVEAPAIEPRKLADKGRLAEHFKESTFNNFIQ